MSYKAFISYSHAADGKLAPALQTALERFAKPWHQMRAFRIFRDSTNLSASPELWTDIETALSESEFLIYMASPRAAASEWVQKEQAFWREHKDVLKLLIVLTDGDIAWNKDTHDFDWKQTTAVPETLTHARDLWCVIFTGRLWASWADGGHPDVPGGTLPMFPWAPDGANGVDAATGARFLRL